MASFPPPGAPHEPVHPVQPARVPEPGQAPRPPIDFKWIGLLLVVVAAVAGFMLLRSGAGSGSGSSSDTEKEVRETATTALTSHDPAECSRVFSKNYLAIFFSASSDEPLGSCPKEFRVDPLPGPDALDVTGVSISGSTATLQGHYTGGALGAADIELTMVDEDGWRVDGLVRASIDREAFRPVVVAMEKRQLAQADSPETAAYITCVGHFLGSPAGIKAYERALPQASAGAHLAIGESAVRACTRELRSSAFQPERLSDAMGLSEDDGACIADKLKAQTSDETLVQVAVAGSTDQPPPSQFTGLRDAALLACTGGQGSAPKNPSAAAVPAPATPPAPSPPPQGEIDALAQSQVRAAETAMETYATDNNGTYVGATVAALAQIEPRLAEVGSLAIVGAPSPASYTVEVTADDGVSFSISRSTNGVLRFRCAPPGEGECPSSGVWN